MDPLQHLQTEARNPASERLDELTSIELVDLMNREDGTVAAAVASQRVQLAQAIDAISERFARGGRLIYMGAGTSGRLGVLDAAECPPTFQSDPEQVVGLIAGGQGAMFRAVEGAEDSPRLGEIDLEAIHLTANDVVCGIASSGRTPYVLGGVKFARKLGAFTLGVVCTSDSQLRGVVDLCIAPVVGPEVLTGSTRLKAGTATKLVLNTLTTGAMVRLGKSFGNLMVDLKATNTKLVARANRIVRSCTDLDADAASQLLRRCGGEVKTAIVAHLSVLDPDMARAKLLTHGGRIKPTLASLGHGRTTAPTRELVVRRDLVLGIDGGGTTTVCLLAEKVSGHVLGKGIGGPSNIQAVGVEAGMRALDDGIDRAFQAAGLSRVKVGSICLGLAGVDRQEGLDVVHGWAERSQVAETVSVSNDATLLLAAGTPDGWGLAVIAGTGSISFVQTPDGNLGRCGGWGFLLGDEGSAYQLALSGLRAACRSFDGIIPPTKLVNAFVKRMNLSEPPDLIPAVYRGPWDRSAIAGMAPLVLELAEGGDEISEEIVKQQARELALTAAGAVKANGLPIQGLPVALAGGVLTNSQLYRRHFLDGLRTAGIEPGGVQLVTEPAVGAVVLARRVANVSPQVRTSPKS
ncbi:MAG: N-acetylmuramic acid 6-phosphate etherase [Fimbriiglobus sp.]|jgi:N-acetylmuramic acid 6-phosphate etherase|nr:N-acetylmuramic acid 6-phosphate etherase [Fimbriiglobus sp.]